MNIWQSPRRSADAFPRSKGSALGSVVLAIVIGLVGAVVLTSWGTEPDPVFTGARP